MHTNQSLTQGARKFRKAVKGELAALGLSVGGLAKRIGRHRNSVSRAINRGEFRGVQDLIKKELELKR